MDRVDGAWIAPLPQRESAAAQAAVVGTGRPVDRRHRDLRSEGRVARGWRPSLASRRKPRQSWRDSRPRPRRPSPGGGAARAANACRASARGGRARGHGRCRQHGAHRRNQRPARDVDCSDGEGRAPVISGRQGQHRRATERTARPRRRSWDGRRGRPWPVRRHPRGGPHRCGRAARSVGSDAGHQGRIYVAATRPAEGRS